MIFSGIRSVLLLLVSLCPAFAEKTFADLYADLCAPEDTVNLAGWQALAAAKLVVGGLGKKMVWPTAETDAKKDAKALTAECTETYHAEERGMFFFTPRTTALEGRGCCNKCLMPMPFGIGGCHDGLSCQGGRCLPAGAMGRFGEGAKKVVGFALTAAVGLAVTMAEAGGGGKAEVDEKGEADKQARAEAAKQARVAGEARRAALRAKAARIKELEKIIKCVQPPFELEKKIREAKPFNMSEAGEAHRILGVNRFSTAKVIKKAHRDLSRLNHPDKHPGEEKLYETKMHELNNAKERLEPQIQWCHEIGEQPFHEAKKANQELQELLRK